MTEGLVPTVLPSKDRARLLRETAVSLFSRTHPRRELRVLDDDSHGGTPGVARQRAGLGPGRGLGRTAADSAVLQRLSSEDPKLPRKRELPVGGLRLRADAGVSFGRPWARWADGFAPARPFKGPGESLASRFPALFAGRPRNTTRPLYRAAVCAAAGPWSDPWLEEDWEYDCRIAALGTRLHQVEDWVCESRDHGGPRLGLGDPLELPRLRRQAEAPVRIFGHARRAGSERDVPELERLARALFLLAGRCGRAGMHGECLRLLRLACEGSTRGRPRGADFALHRWLVALLGVRVGSKFAERLRRRPARSDDWGET